MPPREFAFAVCVCAAALSTSAVAQQPRDPIYSSLERIGDVAARLETTFCDVELARTFQGALDGINAMPERSTQPRVSMNPPGIEGFAPLYGEIFHAAEVPEEVERATLNGMIHAYDPTGQWLSRDDVPYVHQPGDVQMKIEADGALMRVSEVEAGGPAEQAGVRVGDRLIEIDGRSQANSGRSAVQSRLDGPIGSNVLLVVDRDGAELEFTMQRVDRLRGAVSWRRERGVAIIRMRSIPDDGAPALRNAIREIRDERPSGYILDLRGNQGGVLDDVIEVADQFIDSGLIATIRPFSGCHGEEAQVHRARGRDETRGARLVVLIDENTASGAELIAAALNEARDATLIGQRSHGAARVFTVIPMMGGRGGFAKLSTGVMTSPSGATWDQTGLAPDIVTEAPAGAGDPAMERALAILAP